MAAPTFVTVHVAGKGTGTLEMNQGNASVGGSQIDLGTSGNVTILCLVSSTQSNGDGIDYVTVGTTSLTADTALLDWSADFGPSRHRAYSATGVTLTGSQNWTVGRSSGAGFGFDAIFVVLSGGTSTTSTTIAGAVKTATEVYTATISSNSNSLIVALVQKDRKAASCTVSSSGGSTVTDNDATTYGFSTFRNSGSVGSAAGEVSATVIMRAAVWSVEGSASAASPPPFQRFNYAILNH